MSYAQDGRGSRSTGKRKRSRSERPAAPERSSALLALLEHDLHRGHIYVAIRHYEMLKALQIAIPANLDSQCERLLRTCLPSRRIRTMQYVRQWLRMIPEPPDHS
jgi:hypothetical protein